MSTPKTSNPSRTAPAKEHAHYYRSAIARFAAFPIALSSLMVLPSCCCEDERKDEPKPGQWQILNEPVHQPGAQGASKKGDPITVSPPVPGAKATPPASISASSPARPAEAPSTGDKTTRSPCPDDMSLVETPSVSVCMQRFEAQLVYADGQLHDPFKVPPLPKDMGNLRAKSSPGVFPQGYIEIDQARIACENTESAGTHLRLCSMQEWQAACRGLEKKLFPYGSDSRVEGKCNTHKFKGPDHLVLRFHPDTKWNTADMTDPQINSFPGGLARGGEYKECTNSFRVMDLIGNLQEAVGTLLVKIREKEYEYVPIDDPAIKSGDKKGNTIWMGDHYMGQGLNYNGCDARDTAHVYVPNSHWKNQFDYSRGFRCCMDVPKK